MEGEGDGNPVISGCMLFFVTLSPSFQTSGKVSGDVFERKMGLIFCLRLKSIS